LPPKVKVLLETANLDRVFEVCADEAAALASISKAGGARH
jgi:hypothetical protein